MNGCPAGAGAFINDSRSKNTGVAAHTWLCASDGWDGYGEERARGIQDTIFGAQMQTAQAAASAPTAALHVHRRPYMARDGDPLRASNAS